MGSLTAGLRAWGGRAGLWSGLLAITALCWYDLARMSAGTHWMAGSMMAHPMPGAGAALAGIGRGIAMWAAMMVAMMLPTAVTAINLFTRLAGRRSPGRSATAATAMYVAGYAATWVACAAAFALAQWLLTRAALLNPMAQSASLLLSAPILFVAGLYQLTPFKSACLAKCRTPLGFFLAEWRDGLDGAALMGWRHGRFCVGCCWALMAVMFVVGAMNILWMGVLAALMLVEKQVPGGQLLGRLAGVGFLAWAVWIGAGLLV